MRQKDANEVARVLGNEFRTCHTPEEEGLSTAHNALLHHYRYAYPNIDTEEVTQNYRQAISNGM